MLRTNNNFTSYDWLVNFCCSFVESKFEEIFKKHAHKHKNALTYKEIQQLLKTNREPKDIGGWFVFSFLFIYIYIRFKNTLLFLKARIIERIKKNFLKDFLYKYQTTIHNLQSSAYMFSVKLYIWQVRCILIKLGILWYTQDFIIFRMETITWVMPRQEWFSDERDSKGCLRWQPFQTIGETKIISWQESKTTLIKSYNPIHCFLHYKWKFMRLLHVYLRVIFCNYCVYCPVH